MSEDLTIELLQMAVAHTLRPLGWQAMSASAGDVLADVMGSYILAVAKGIVGYSCHGMWSANVDLIAKHSVANNCIFIIYL